EYRARRRAGERLLPNLAGIELWHPLACVGWPAPATNPPAPLPAGELPPYLGVGSWTDFDGTADLVRRVPGSAAVQYQGYGHGLYNSGVSCVVAHVNRHLISLRLPAPGTECRAAASGGAGRGVPAAGGRHERVRGDKGARGAGARASADPPELRQAAVPRRSPAGAGAPRARPGGGGGQTG